MLNARLVGCHRNLVLRVLDRSAWSVVKRVLRLFDELIKCDKEGALADVRKAAEGSEQSRQVLPLQGPPQSLLLTSLVTCCKVFLPDRIV